MSRLRDRLTARIAAVLTVSLTAGLVTVVAEPVTGPAPAAAAATTFTYTGTPQLYVVPGSGAVSLAVTIKGAGGGTPSGGAAGGGGGTVTATIAAQGGQVFQVNVGGQGTPAGGWNGGGAGFGGGASDIRTDSGSSLLSSCAYSLTCALTDRLVVAGGGGGGGSVSGSTGGVGGSNATAGTAGGSGATAGQPGTSTAGGNAGTGAGTAPTAGTSGSGGAAGYGTGAQRGGGGGGGYNGGGGGAVNGTTGAGGGGGGFSWTGGTGVTNVNSSDGDNAGNGEITINPGNALPSVAPNSNTPPVSTSIVYAYTGAAQVYSVPNDVELIHVTLFGGSGSGAAEGDVVSGMFPVSPGGFLQINVGGRGTGWVDDGTGAMDVNTSYKGGWNGGGNGAQASSGTAGGGGGGATDIRMCGTAVVGGCNVTERRVIAAGGGGDGAPDTGTAGGGNADGSAADPTGTASGEGGTLDQGGAGGAAVGENGGPGYGGRARPASGGTGGGGGGGGLYGGGGGNATNGGAGGGGSSCASITGACTKDTNELTPPVTPVFTSTAPVFTHRQGGNIGNGFAVITAVPIARTGEDAASPAQTTPPDDVTANTATIHGAVNPMNLAAEPQVFYAVQPQSPAPSPVEVAGEPSSSKVVLHQRGTTPTPGAVLTGSSWLNVEGGLTGLNPSTTYDYRVCTKSVAGLTCGPIKSFTTMAPPADPAVGNPSVVTDDTTNTSATFTGTVNPGTGPTTVVFECATDSGFTQGLVTGTAVQSPLTGTTSRTVDGSCTGLTPGTAYFVQIKATNTGTPAPTNPTVVSAASATFTTQSAPTIQAAPTVTAGSVAASYAAFSGTLNNPGGGTSTAATTISYECSTDASFPNSTAHPTIVGSATPNVATGTSAITNITGSCGNLTSYTTYYARMTATNSTGTTNSPVSAAFQTLPIVVPPTLSTAPTTSNVGETTVSLTGTLDDAGHGPTSIFFDCSTTAPFTVGTYLTFPASPASVSGTGSTTNLTGSCVGLTAGTQYYVRIRAVNSAAVAGVSSPSATFTTLSAPPPPTVSAPTLQSGSPITTTSIAVQATVSPGTASATVDFECSTSATFPAGSSTQTVTASPATVTSANTTVTATCSTLANYTKYYVRVKAANTAAPNGIFGAVDSWTTQAPEIPPVMGSITVVNGSVTDAAATFSFVVTNPGSGNTSGSWSTTTLGINCYEATDTTYTNPFPGTVTSPSPAQAAGRTSVSGTGTCIGLTGNTAYVGRAYATNAASTTTNSATAAFTTLHTPIAPTVSNLVVATSPPVTDSSASFTATVTAGWSPVTVEFECSADSTFPNNVTYPTLTVAGSPTGFAGNTATTVSATCSPLAASTTYYVRVKATKTTPSSTVFFPVSPTTVTFTTDGTRTLPATSNASLTAVSAPSHNPNYTSVLLSGQITNTGGGGTSAEFQCATSPSFAGAVTVPAYTDAALTIPATSQNSLSAIPIYAKCGSGTVSDPALTSDTTYYARIRVWNTGGSGAGEAYSSTAFMFRTAAYEVTPTIGAVTTPVLSVIDGSGSSPWTTTIATAGGSITNPGSGNIAGSWSDTTVGIQCATSSSFTSPITGTVTNPASPHAVSGQSAVAVAGTCSGLAPDTDYWVRFTATNTPTDQSTGNPGTTATVNGTAVQFHTVGIVSPPVFTPASVPAPPFANPTVTSIAIDTPAGSNTTEVTGTVVAGTTVTIKVNGIERMNGANPPAPTDVCTVTGTTYVCVLDPEVAADDTLTVISTDSPTPPVQPQSTQVSVIVPASGTTPVTTPPAVVTITTPMTAEKVEFTADLNPGTGPTTVSFVYSTDPVFGTSNYASVTSGLITCVTSAPFTGTSASASRMCVNFPNNVTTYWVRAKATNSPTDGTTSPITVWSNATMFTTVERSWAPSAPLGIDVTATTFTSLSFSTIVDPGNASTTVTYQCSTDPTFTIANDPNLVTVVAPQSPVSGPNVVPTTATCTGLVAATQYHVRVLLVNRVNSGSATITASTLSSGGGGGGAGGGSGGGTGGPAPVAPGSLGPVVPNPFLLPGEFTVMENGVAVPGAYTATANGAQISRGDFSVTFRGLSRDREPMALGPAPKSAVIMACQGFLQVAGNVFQSSSVGKLYLFEGGSLLYEIPMNSSGGFSVTVPLPSDVVGGNYDLQLNAYGKSGTPPVVRSITVGAIVDTCPPPPPVTIIGKKQVTTIQQVYFDDWSAELDAKAQDTLRKLVKQTSRDPLKVKSVGFVQGKGTPPKGWVLSQQRADNVLDFLTGKGKMTPKKAVAKGRNVDGNVSPNRTVQVTVIWKKPVNKQVPADQVPPGAVVVPHGAVPAGAKTSAVTESVATAPTGSATHAVSNVTAAKQALKAAKAARKAAKAALAVGSVTKAEKRALTEAKAAVKTAKKALRQAVTKPVTKAASKVDSATKADATKQVAKAKADAKTNAAKATVKAAKAEKKADRLIKKAERVAKKHGAESKAATKAAKKAAKAQQRADRLAHPKP